MCEETSLSSAAGSYDPMLTPSHPLEIPPRPPLAKGGWGDLVGRRGRLRTDANHRATGCPWNSFTGSQGSVVGASGFGARHTLAPILLARIVHEETVKNPGLMIRIQLPLGEPPALPGWLPQFDSSGSVLFLSKLTMSLSTCTLSNGARTFDLIGPPRAVRPL